MLNSPSTECNKRSMLKSIKLRTLRRSPFIVESIETASMTATTSSSMMQRTTMPSLELEATRQEASRP